MSTDVGAREHGDDLPTCTTPGCVRVARARGLCQPCYHRDRRARKKRGEGTKCRVANCPRGVEVRGRCFSHYMTIWRQVEAKLTTWREQEALGTVSRSRR